MERYIKEFDKWNGVKKGLDIKNHELFFYEKEIWWCSLGVNVGSEQDGKGPIYLRPVLVYKKINTSTFLGIPLTTVLNEDDIHFPFYFDYNLQTALISQIRILDRKRLIKRRGEVSNYLFLKIKRKVIAFIQ